MKRWRNNNLYEKEQEQYTKKKTNNKTRKHTNTLTYIRNIYTKKPIKIQHEVLRNRRRRNNNNNKKKILHTITRNRIKTNISHSLKFILVYNTYTNKHTYYLFVLSNINTNMYVCTYANSCWFYGRVFVCIRTQCLMLSCSYDEITVTLISVAKCWF